MTELALPPVPVGYRRIWEPDDYWRLATDVERRTKGCRWGAGFNHPSCGAPPVAAFNRGRKTRDGKVTAWWFYCPLHLYGRRVRADGTVERQRIVKVEP